MRNQDAPLSRRVNEGSDIVARKRLEVSSLAEGLPTDRLLTNPVCLPDWS
jgi:hypothetical protein